MWPSTQASLCGDNQPTKSHYSYRALLLPATVNISYSFFKFVVPCTADLQGDSGGICTTLGNDSMSDSKEKSSYEHGSDFEWLRSYGNFLIPVHALLWTALMEPTGGCLYCKHYFCQLTTSEWVSGNCNKQLAQFTTERQPVLRPAVTFPKTSFKHRSIQIKGNFAKLTLHLYFKCIMYCAGLLFSSVHCQ